MNPCTSGTDVKFELFNDPSPSAPRGFYVCLTRVGDICYHSQASLNTAKLTDSFNKNKTMCHEIGHSVGLTHGGGTTDCMLNGPVSQQTSSYNSHHREHINAWIACLANPLCTAFAVEEDS